MAVVLSSSYGTLSREELRQTREDMAFMADYLRNMTERQKTAYRKNPEEGMRKILKLARKAQKQQAHKP